MLHDDGVAGEHRGDNRVHGGEERVVPRGQIEHDAEGRLRDAALEAFLRREHDVGERLLRDLLHVAPAPCHAFDLATRLRERLAHLPRDVLRDLLGACLELRERPIAERDALLHAHRGELAGSLAGIGEDVVDGRLIRHVERRGGFLTCKRVVNRVLGTRCHVGLGGSIA